MQRETNDGPNAVLEEMWREHSTFLKYLLAGFTHDLNLAGDLLQETYVNARTGIAGYAGGNSRAWLTQIAKRAFFSHLRRRYIRAEEPLNAAEDAASNELGSLEHLLLIEIRRAVAELAPSLREALIMKHYGGLTYNEIAERQGCPVGTAKWRISTAIGRLRTRLAAMEQETGRMECGKLSGTMLVDYVYRLLPPEEAEKARLHLAICASCREEAETIRMVATALDEFEQEDKSQVFYELDADGSFVMYGFKSWPNNTAKPLDAIRFADTGPGVQPELPLYASAHGESLAVEVESVTPNEVIYTAKLTHPIQPGECRDLLIVRRSESAHVSTPFRAQQGVRMFRPGLIVKDSGEVSVRVEAVRLPPGARLLSCSPEPDELRTNNTTTLMWRRVLADWETFGLVVVYQLKPQETT